MKQEKRTPQTRMHDHKLTQINKKTTTLHNQTHTNIKTTTLHDQSYTNIKTTKITIKQKNFCNMRYNNLYPLFKHVYSTLVGVKIFCFLAIVAVFAVATVVSVTVNVIITFTTFLFLMHCFHVNMF